MSHDGSGRSYLTGIARACFEHGASYVYIMPENKPLARIGLDQPVPFGDSPLEKTHIEEFLDSQVPSPHKEAFASTGFARFAFALCPGARCRVDLIMTVDGPSAVMHFLPDTLPGIDMLNVPGKVIEFAAASSGVFLICGKPRAGKTTTLASILQKINRTFFNHIVWICEASEYLLGPSRSFVNQIETGYLGKVFDVTQRAVWIGADVVALDIRIDENLAWQAVSAAERGASVLMVVPASDAVAGLENLANTVSSASRQEFAARLSRVFSGALYQELIQGVKSPVPAIEFLVGTEPVRNLLREGRFPRIKDLIAAGGKYGMKTLESSKQRLSDEGLI